jgi:hypothetical protein
VIPLILRPHPEHCLRFLRLRRTHSRNLLDSSLTFIHFRLTHVSVNREHALALFEGFPHGRPFFLPFRRKLRAGTHFNPFL